MTTKTSTHIKILTSFILLLTFCPVTQAMDFADSSSSRSDNSSMYSESSSSSHDVDEIAQTIIDSDNVFRYVNNNKEVEKLIQLDQEKKDILAENLRDYLHTTDSREYLTHKDFTFEIGVNIRDTTANDLFFTTANDLFFTHDSQLVYLLNDYQCNIHGNNRKHLITSGSRLDNLSVVLFNHDCSAILVKTSDSDYSIWSLENNIGKKITDLKDTTREKALNHWKIIAENKSSDQEIQSRLEYYKNPQSSTENRFTKQERSSIEEFFLRRTQFTVYKIADISDNGLLLMDSKQLILLVLASHIKHLSQLNRIDLNDSQNSILRTAFKTLLRTNPGVANILKDNYTVLYRETEKSQVVNYKKEKKENDKCCCIIS